LRDEHESTLEQRVEDELEKTRDEQEEKLAEEIKEELREEFEAEVAAEHRGRGKRLIMTNDASTKLSAARLPRAGSPSTMFAAVPSFVPDHR
jgi:ribosomal protein RSM22 (predicted rRNA methylase)